MIEIPMYINGEWVHTDEKIDVLNPSNGEQIGTLARGKDEHIDAAVKAAKAAFYHDDWRSVKAFERGRILFQIANKIAEHRDELARLEALDVGKPLAQAYADIEASIRYFEFYGGASDKVMGDTIPIEDGIIDYVVREPIGVTAHIIPWNYPIQILSRSVAAAIATGNTVVLKSAEDTPMTAAKVTELIAEIDLPKGVFNHVTGYGKEAGAPLTSHKGVNHITFTGSVVTGKAVAHAAMENIVPVTLELGGKSPNLVFADANLEEAAKGVVNAIIQNAGQTCSAGSRLLVEESIKEEFLERVIGLFENLVVGQAIDDKDLGPILNKKQFNQIMDYLALAKEEGIILSGGEALQIEGAEKGHYIAPTIIDGLKHESRLAQEEIFGPVLSVFTFKSDSEALELANGTDYGLVAGIWTSDVSRAHLLADRIEAGQIFVNNYGAGGGVQMPFGGYKQSGIGREKGWIALYNYTQIKNVALKYK